jgi:hypothetical protein
MKRMTDPMLEVVIERINFITGSPYKYGEPGNYYLQQAYGGVQLRRTQPSGGDIDVLQIGYTNKRNLYEHMHTFIRGLNTIVDDIKDKQYQNITIDNTTSKVHLIK